MALQHLRSSTAHKRPIPSVMSAGQLAINTNEASPGLFFKDSNGDLVKVGPVHIGTTAPNSSPASVAATALVTGTVYQILTVGTSDFTLVGASANTVGTIFTATGTTTGTGTVSGQQGVEKGEQWLDTTGGAYDLKIYDGTDWRSQAGEFVNATGDTMTGDLVMNNANIVFEGATADDFETTLTVTDPTADRSIVLPDVSGDIVTTGDTGTVTSTMILDGTIANADISSTAEIAVSKLANGTTRQLLQTDAAGTGVEFTSNVDVPGTLDVTGATTLDSTLTVTGLISADGRVSFPAGTAAAPSLYSGSDTNTGIYSPGSDQLAISTNGTGRLFVDANGNVGLGISPTTRFHVYQSGSTQAGLIETNQSASVLNFKSTGQSSGQPQVGCASSDMILNTNGIERLRITSTGTVNIVGAGTAGTTQAVHFNGSAPVNSLVVNSSGSVGIGTSSPGVEFEVSASEPEIRLRDTRVDDAGYWGFKSELSTGERKLFIQDDGADRITLDSSGNVGIGTTSPGAKLHVAYASGNPQIIIERTTSSTAKYGLHAFSNTFTIRDEAQSQERLRIDSSGNVGIGTTSPATYGNKNLEVNGGSGGAYLVVKGASGADIGELAADGDIYLSAKTSSALIFRTADTQRMRIDSSGNVGVGTSNPGSVLHARGGSIASPSTTSDFIANATARLVVNHANEYGAYIGYANSATDAIAIQAATNGAATKPLLLNPYGGNVGIGTTSPTQPLEVAGGFIKNDTGVLLPTARYNGASGGAYISTNATDNPIQFVTGAVNSERARIDSSGRLLVGTSSARQTGSGFTARLQVEGPDTVSSSSFTITSNRSVDDLGPRLNFARSKGGSAGSNTIVDADAEYGGIYFFGADGTDTDSIGAQISAYVDGTPGSNDMPGRLVFSTNGGAPDTSPTERMRIQSSGRILLGTSSTTYASASWKTTSRVGVVTTTSSNSGDVAIECAAGSTSLRHHISFSNTNGVVGSISTSASATAYNTSSDHRLKENVVDIADGITRVKQLAPKRFNFIADAETTVDGFLAHEAQTVVPEAVTGTHNEVDDDGNPVYQGIDQSKLVPLLTAALQEAIGEIESLKARVSVLEAN